jgi:hypothetical protein
MVLMKVLWVSSTDDYDGYHEKSCSEAKRTLHWGVISGFSK